MSCGKDHYEPISFGPPGSPPVVPLKGKHGGRRPGAGAPRGNLNALKHGRYSNQMTAFTHRFARDPELRRLLQTLARPAARHGLAREQSRKCGLFESTKGQF